MQIAVVTLFPELFQDFANTSFVGRACGMDALQLHLEPLRAQGLGRHQSVDDTPYGGGSGMVLRVDCVVQAIESAETALGGRAHRVLLTPQGQPLRQAMCAELAARDRMVLVCGRYEGFDERVRSFVDQEISLGDFVLTGGEVAAMAVIESCIRLLPGVLGNEESPLEESFAAAGAGLLEYPHYTRPVEFRGLMVPELLRTGNHGKIAEWRRAEAIARTRARRPDLAPPEED
ncbi:MAG: tRNA (guanosine(37)-N1)-methyltransferase TrmD [Polyangiaceae bacterium]